MKPLHACLFAAALALNALPSAHAAPVVFGVALHDVTASADADGVSDDAASVASPDALPLVAAADALGTRASASALALADAGLLTTYAEAMAGGTPASATAVAGFSGSFIGEGVWYDLSLDVDRLLDGGASLGAVAGAQLAVLLSAGGDTLLDQMFALDRDRHFRVFIPEGAEGLFELSLVGVADADDGFASALASVAYGLNTVPEPDALALVLAGVSALVSVRRAGRCGRPRGAPHR